MDFADAVARWDPVLGIEVHVELGTRTKMFDGAPVTFGGEPNTHTTPVSLGLPGSLPVPNRAAVESAIRIGLALNCEIAASCRFARKNYFYPDMPKNFQTSQYDEPIARDGYLDVELEDGTLFRVEIERAHIEEDAGKITHVGGDTGRIHGARHALVDYNRAGVPLVEIVTKPIVGAGRRAPAVGRAYVQALRDIFRVLGVSEARMERGNVRADINVSLRSDAGAPLGIRTETKNVNSLRSVSRAIEYEIARQAAVLESGREMVQETRHWHEDTGTTSPGRVKSDAEDYRYFPEPDLMPIVPDPEWIAALRAGLPELPAVRRRRLRAEWGFSEQEMRDITNAGAVDLIAGTVAAGASPAAARKWWMGELSRAANAAGVELEALGVTPAQVAEIATLIEAGELTDRLARQVLDGVLAGEGDPAAVVAARGLRVVTDDADLLRAVDAAIAADPDAAARVRAGRVQAIGALVGAVMRATKGQADAARVRQLLAGRLGVEGAPGA